MVADRVRRGAMATRHMHPGGVARVVCNGMASTMKWLIAPGGQAQRSRAGRVSSWPSDRSIAPAALAHRLSPSRMPAHPTRGRTPRDFRLAVLLFAQRRRALPRAATHNARPALAADDVRPEATTRCARCRCRDLSVSPRGGPLVLSPLWLVLFGRRCQREDALQRNPTPGTAKIRPTEQGGMRGQTANAWMGRQETKGTSRGR
jgi:hypothetical protein